MMSTLFIFRISYASSRRCFVPMLVLALLSALLLSSSSLKTKLVADSFFVRNGTLILSELAILIFPIVLCTEFFGY